MLSKLKEKNFKQPLLFSILILVLIFSGVKAYNYYFSLNSQKVVNSISYNNAGTLRYNVCLVENKFIEQECFSENRSFVTSLVDYIEVLFNYNSSSSDYVDYNFDYVVTANLIANERGDTSKVVYDKEEVLLKDSLVKPSISNFNINKRIKIDYQRYNDLVTEFKRNYVLALDSTLVIKVDMMVIGTAFDIDKKIEGHKTMQIVMPLSEQTLSIDSTKSSISNNGRIDQTVSETNTTIKYILFDIYSIIVAVTVILLIVLIIKALPNKSEYSNKIKKILKDYDGAIAVTKAMPDISDYTAIEIETFEEMIDVRNNLEKPILFYRDDKKKFCNFLILNVNEVYICQIRDEKKKKLAGKNDDKDSKK